MGFINVDLHCVVVLLEDSIFSEKFGRYLGHTVVTVRGFNGAETVLLSKTLRKEDHGSDFRSHRKLTAILVLVVVSSSSLSCHRFDWSAGPSASPSARKRKKLFSDHSSQSCTEVYR